jgi:hypothetical protein
VEALPVWSTACRRRSCSRAALARPHSCDCTALYTFGLNLFGSVYMPNRIAQGMQRRGVRVVIRHVHSVTFRGRRHR